MNLVSPITKACDDLEQAGHDGYLVNQSMAAFIFCKSLLQKLPDAHVVYDGRTCRDSETSPNLYIWQDGVTPVVHFIGLLRYEPHDIGGDPEQIQSLEDHAAMPAISILDRDPVSLKYIEQQVKTAPRLELGLFVTDGQDIKIRYWSANLEHDTE